MMWPRPISPSTFSTGTLTLSKIDGRGGAALDAHLLFFGAAGDAAERALHQERGELLAADLGEDGEQIRRAAVGDPHLLPVEDVVRAVGAEVGAGARGQRIGAGLRLAEA